MVLGKLPVPGRPSRARAYCACSRCGWGMFGHFFSPFSPALWETARYRLKYCLKGSLNPQQPTNQSCLRNSYISQGILMKLSSYCFHDLEIIIFYGGHSRLILAELWSFVPMTWRGSYYTEVTHDCFSP